MARRARLKVTGAGAWYHLYSRMAGKKGEYPLAEKHHRRRFIELLRFYSRVYFTKIAGFTVMGNHYHLVAWFEQPFQVPREELKRRALLLYPDDEEEIDAWTPKQWSRFEERLFDVSEFMRNLQAGFARWYNRVEERKGRFWGDRFKSTLLEDADAVRNCLLYVELNPVRAGLVERPEEYAGSSIYLRESGLDGWLLPLRELVGRRSRKEALREHKAQLYYRGAVAGRDGQAVIPSEVVRREESRGFRERGVYAKRLRYFVDGVALGSEAFVREQLSLLRSRGGYLRRKNPVKSVAGECHVLREQRSNEVHLK